ncbi:MAG: phytanoyl-CoA dioxygenase family protein [Actinomycetota bacterium]
MKPALDADRYVSPSPARSEGPLPLNQPQVEQWRSEGYVLVDGVLPAALVDRVATTARAHFPAAGSAEATTINDFGSAVNFPNRLDGFNEITLHPRIIGACAQLLDRPATGLRLSQSDLWPKYGRAEPSPGMLDNQDQRIHVDYPNHTLAHPSPWDRPEAVEMIIYLDEVDDCGGSTAVVPRQGPDDPAYRWPIVDSPGIADLNYINDRHHAEAYLAEQRPGLALWRQTLYERERWTRFSPGTILFYRHDTWHRGTPMIPSTRRLVHNITYRRAECEWISTLHVGWAWKAYRADKYLERLIATSSLDQRAVLGFPQPDDEYWCDETIEAVVARHGVFGFDPAPYRDALATRNGT